MWTAVFFFSSRRRHTRCLSDWSSDVCSSDLVNPYLKSKPAFREKRLEYEAAAAWSVVNDDATYGFSSRFIDCAGVSRPTSVPADDTLKRPLWPYALGTRVRNDVSFFHLPIRRKLIPHTS